MSIFNSIKSIKIVKMKLFNDFMNEYLFLAPLSATYIGIHDYDDRLINYYENI